MVVEKIDIDTLYQEQIRQEQQEKNDLYKRIKELSDEVYVLKGQIQGLEFQIKDYQGIVKELSERVATDG